VQNKFLCKTPNWLFEMQISTADLLHFGYFASLCRDVWALDCYSRPEACCSPELGLNISALSREERRKSNRTALVKIQILFSFICSLFKDAGINSDYIPSDDQMVVPNEWERIWKGAVPVII
jgi:hypothetical protein